MLFWVLLGLNFITSFVWGVYLAETTAGLIVFAGGLFTFQLLIHTALVSILSLVIKENPDKKVVKKRTYYTIIEWDEHQIIYWDSRKRKQKMLPVDENVRIFLNQDGLSFGPVLAITEYKTSGWRGRWLFKVAEYEPSYIVFE